jgi:(p)ppGpp synthase/HD superfamily hydrolase
LTIEVALGDAHRARRVQNMCHSGRDRQPPVPRLTWQPGERFERALVFADRAHAGQPRKSGGETAIPYISHLLGVCSLVIEAGGSEDEAIAALLHDAAEDQGGEEMLDRIEAEFGPDVRRVVDACSDTLEQPKPPWRARKESYIAKLASKRDDELRVSLADKVHNAERSCSTTEHLGRQSSTASKPAATRHSGTTRSSRMRSPSDSRGHSPTSLRG